jgi:hypothetical protein
MLAYFQSIRFVVCIVRYYHATLYQIIYNSVKKSAFQGAGHHLLSTVFSLFLFKHPLALS